jgi:WXG100 family type VII secretion target
VLAVKTGRTPSGIVSNKQFIPNAGSAHYRKPEVIAGDSRYRKEACAMSGTVYVGSEEFKVDLQQYTDATAKVTADKNTIEDDFSQIKAALDDLGSTWESPAGDTYDNLQSSLTSATQQMISVLDDIISRMNATYQTYVNAEQSNAQNLT